jgi:hypothetical protein
MSKKYEVKVYDQDGDYITTWKDVVSDIQFNNEINSAGGQLKLTLARNAGDYGEGTDLDFNYKVIVTCFDIEKPNGLIIFQGYISGYTPIYKDDKVEVTILGYGSELNNYIIEGGSTSYLSQTTQNTSASVKVTGTGAKIDSWTGVIQTFKVSSAIKLDSVIMMTSNTSGATDSPYIVVYEMTGTSPSIVGDLYVDTSNNSAVAASETQILHTFTFNRKQTLNPAKTYFFFVISGNPAVNGADVKFHYANTNPYANGQLYTYTYTPNSYTFTSVPTGDLYFNIYSYGGETSRSFTLKDPSTEILEPLITDYNNFGGHLVVPTGDAIPYISQLEKSISLPTAYWGASYSQVFNVTSVNTVSAIMIYANYGWSVLNIYKGNPSLDLLTTIGGITTYDVNANNTLIATSTASEYTSGSSGTNVNYKFNTPPTLQPNTNYYFVLLFGQGESTALNLLSASVADTITDDNVGRLYIARNTINNTNSSPSFQESYPALYFAIFNDYPLPTNINGGYKKTNTDVSYTFKVQTLYEGINVLKDLAPENWYWYVDQGKSEIEFKVMSDEPNHIFSLDKDIVDAKFEKRIEDIVNTIYFTGGDTGGGISFYKKYTNQKSVDLYGIKSTKYTDTRVTTSATADLIGNNILATRSQPELRVTLEILDSNNNQGMGYDIESLQVGDVVAVRNITQQVGLSTWDVARWDEAYWDYNVYNLSSLRLQIQKIDYKENSAIIYASTLPVDVNKRIEQINRNLEAIQTLYNPNAPS